MIGAGFGRTGTASLQEAMEILYELEDKHCYHFFSILTRPAHARLWIQLLRCKVQNMDWDELFSNTTTTDTTNFVATQDHPCCNFYKELLAYYPNAKVILSTHPSSAAKQSWHFKSCSMRRNGGPVSRWSNYLPFQLCYGPLPAASEPSK